jgi:DNA ligase (NAD+)
MSKPNTPVVSDDGFSSLSIEELEARIRHHNHLYWDLAQPEISDYDFDRLVSRLKALQPASAVLSEMGPTPGGRAGTEVVHAAPMLSLDKCYADEDLNDWAAKLEGEVMVMPKMDGIAASLRYDAKGRLVLAATRGSGLQGDDITVNARTIRDIPSTVPEGEIEVRGEIYMRLSVFADFAADFSNPRNLTAGAIKHKDPARCRAYSLSFGAYDLLGTSLPTEEEKMKRLRAMGFAPVTHELTKRDQLREAYERFATRRSSLDFEIDGVVFKANRVDEQERLGSTAHHPRYAMAYKFQGDSGTTVLRRVEWSVARSGAITPVAHVEPVTLSGAEVRRASLHNAGFVEKLGLLHQPPGAKLVLTRRGGVIPKVEFVAQPAPAETAKNAETIELPIRCPSCGGPVRQEKDFLYCAKPETCRGAIISAIAHYCAALDILGFGDKLLAQAYDQAVLRSPVDLYLLTEEKLLGLERVGKKLAQKLIKEVNSRRGVPLATFLRALGIDELGRHVSEILEEKYGTLDRVRGATAEELSAIHTIGDEIATRVVSGLKAKAALIDALEKHVSIPSPAAPEKAAAAKSGALSGQSFVFTGTLLGLDRRTAQKRVQALGGETPDGVTRTLTFLVVGDGAEERKSSKQVKAQKYIAEGAPLKIISESEFLKLIGGG